MTQTTTEQRIVEISMIPSILVSVEPGRIKVSTYQGRKSITQRENHLTYLVRPAGEVTDREACAAVREFMRIRYPESQNHNKWVGSVLGADKYLFTMANCD